jgi:hypothetical protein
MAQESTIKQYSNFSKGIMTEASPLNFPDDYSLDEANMLLHVDGSRERRDGIEHESGNAITTTTTTTAAVGMAFYKWEFADNKATNTIGVVQVGQALYFMDLETNAPSANLLNGGSAVSLTGIMANAVPHPRVSFSTINGVLLITSSDFSTPAKISYDTDADTMTLSFQKILVRDLWGVDDSLDVDEEISTLSDKHNYNLLNQGWTAANITAYDTAIGAYPGNHKVMHLGKDSTGAWSAATLNESFFGNSPAPKGRFILNFFDRGDGSGLLGETEFTREDQSGVSNLDADIETGYLSAVTTNFGRVFWAGSESDITSGDSKSPNASSLILYSQIIEREEQIGYCYQEADPTAEVIFDQVDSDGGHIQIPELGKVIKMVPMQNQVIVLANNGVWAIVSVDGLFTPTSYQVNKVTAVGAIGPDSVVEVEGTLVYWSESGIYQLKLDEVSQQAVVADVTLQTIKSLYNMIDKDAKTNAKGYYDSITKQVGWLYQSDADWDYTNFPDFCDKELIYDLQLQAFTVNTISSKTVQSPYVTGAVLGQNLNTNTTIETVEVNGDPVTVNGEVVEQTTSQTVQSTSKLKYLTYVPQSGFAGFTLSQYADEDFLDWGTENYVSFIETGYIGFQDWARNKRVPYLICHFERTENGFDANLAPLNESSCLVQAKWEWTDNSASNRWGTQFQAYRYRRPYVPENSSDRFETGHLIITTRNKLRGWGKALSLRFQSEQGKNMKLYGFAIKAVGNQDV